MMNSYGICIPLHSGVHIGVGLNIYATNLTLVLTKLSMVYVLSFLLS